MPANADGGSAIESIEVTTERHVELYSCAGWAYAERSTGNRVVREYTVGGDYRAAAPRVRGTAIFSLQFSRMDRAVWTGQSGAMFYAMCRFRFAFN